MCYRYAFDPAPKIHKDFNIREYIKIEPSYNIAPGANAPVIYKVKQNKMEYMKWGLIPKWAKDKKIGCKLANARSETVDIKQSFKDSFINKRCIVPASGFYEWKNESGVKQPYYITPKNENYFTFAGLYSNWQDINGDIINSYNILTTKPSKILSAIHERMPVILLKKEAEIWLDNNITEIDLLKEFLKHTKVKINLYQVSTKVNSVNNNNKTLISKV